MTGVQTCALPISEADPGAVLQLGALPEILALVASDRCVRAQDALGLSLCGALLRTLHALCAHPATRAAVCEGVVERPSAVAALDGYAAAGQGATARHADAILKTILRRSQQLSRASSLSGRHQGLASSDHKSVSGGSLGRGAETSPAIKAAHLEARALDDVEENPTPPRGHEFARPAESPSTGESHEGSEEERPAGFARRALLTRLLGQETASELSFLGTDKGTEASDRISSGE